MSHPYDKPLLPSEIHSSYLEDLFDQMLVDNNIKVDGNGRAVLRFAFFSGCLGMVHAYDHGRIIAETHGDQHKRIFQLIHNQLMKEINTYVETGFAPVIGFPPARNNKEQK